MPVPFMQLPRPLLFVLAAGASASCGAEPQRHAHSDEHCEPPAVGTVAEGLSSIDCTESQATGYSSGTPFTITLVTVDGKKVEKATANAYYVMAQAAANAGVTLKVVSGFRTMAEQQYLYNCYVNCNCNNCNLAAKPGYSNHQSGHAVDLNTSSSGVYTWLNANAASYGFKRTVPSEAWHWEWWGGGPGGGPCGGATLSCSEACGKYGCSCVDNQCSGGYCPGSGCSAQETSNCGAFGCACVDHKCSGAYCPGTGCTAKETDDCAEFGCNCVDHQCSGGFCPGTGCTAKETNDCAGFGCQCVDHKCSGGFCPGTGCTAKESKDCAAFGCDCVDHKCSGGIGCTAQGTGCTAKETKDCAGFGCGCADHKCKGGACAGTGGSGGSGGTSSGGGGTSSGGGSVGGSSFGGASGGGTSLGGSGGTNSGGAPSGSGAAPTGTGGDGGSQDGGGTGGSGGGWAAGAGVNGAGAAGIGAAPGSGSGDSNDAVEGQGCACRAAPSPRGPRGYAILAIVGTLAALWRRRRVAGGVLGGAAFALAFACGGSSHSPNTPASARALCDELEESMEEVASRCTDEPSHSEMFGLGVALVGGAPALCRLYVSQLDKGRLAVDGEKLRRCRLSLEAIREGAPRADRDFECLAFLVGKQTVGQPCARSPECEPGLACVGYGTNDDGQCRPLPRVGERCGARGLDESPRLVLGSSPDCADRAECIVYKEGGTCVATPDTRCSSLIPCAGDRPCVRMRCVARASNPLEQECDDSFDCNGARKCGKDQRCHETRKAGNACREDADCAGECRGGRCVSVCGSG